jgi:predicted PurR-regulated permease PerM
MLDNDYLNYSLLGVFIVIIATFCVYALRELRKLIDIIIQTKKSIEPMSQGVSNINDILEQNTGNISTGISSLVEAMGSINKLIGGVAQRFMAPQGQKPVEIKQEVKDNFLEEKKEV